MFPFAGIRQKCWIAPLPTLALIQWKQTEFMAGQNESSGGLCVSFFLFLFCFSGISFHSHFRDLIFCFDMTSPPISHKQIATDTLSTTQHPKRSKSESSVFVADWVLHVNQPLWQSY
jgi:hypothetical protein